MPTLDELMLMSSLQSPNEPTIWQDFRSDWSNALANLDARTRDLRAGETPESLREDILAPIEAKWGAMLGLPGGRSYRTSQAQAETGWRTIERPDGSLIRVNSRTGEAEPFGEQQQAAPEPRGGGFYYAGSEAGLPIARERFAAGLPSMVGRVTDAGPQREATSLFQGATPTEAIGGGAQMVGNFLQNLLGLPSGGGAGPAAAAPGALTGPMAEPSSTMPASAPRIENLRYGETNTLPVMVFENKSGTHVSRIPQTQGMDARKVIVTRLMADRGNFTKQLTDPFTTPDRRKEVEGLITKLDDQLKSYGVDIGGAGSAAPTTQTAGAPKIGEVRRGYRYRGGNPALQSSWEKI